MKSNAAQFPLKHTGPLTNPYESLIIGNGDLAASAQVFSQELRLTLGKNDVWDSRLNTITEDVVLKHDDLIRYSREYGFEADRPAVDSIYYDWPGRPSDLKICNFGLGVPGTMGTSKVGPSPKIVGAIRIMHPGLSGTPVESQVDISRGILTVVYQFPQGALTIESFVHREKNNVLVKLSSKGSSPWLSLLLEKTPDATDPEMPLPVVESTSDPLRWSISQNIPGKYDVPDFSWSVAGAFAQKVTPKDDHPGTTHVAAEDYVVSELKEWAHSLQQDIRLIDGESVVLSVAVATDRDGTGDTQARALEIAGSASTEVFEEKKQSHIEAWNDFWSASAIDLEDKELESLWYRSLYSFACHLKSGAQAPGLNANIPIYDHSAWHGFYTWNHNVQKWYFAAGETNHLEWYDVLADLLEQNTPMFEHLARVIFGLEGVYCDLMSHPFQPPHRALSHSKQGRALCHGGWLSMLLFHHYQYSGDAAWLEKRAYDYIGKAADFYANYLEKYQEEDGDIYPSIRLEDHGWGKNFLGNRNVATDLVMFRKAFQVAIAASEALQTDEERRSRWETYLKRVPEIQYGWKDGQGWYALCREWEKVWPDFEDYLYHSRYSRWGCGAWMVFPGEYLDGDEEEGLAAAVRDLIDRVDLDELPKKMTVLGTFHGEATVTPYIRLGLVNHYEKVRGLLLNHRFSSGLYSNYSTGTGEFVRTAYIAEWRIHENQYMPLLGVTEMLFQSQGEVLRFFPFWPQEQAASFSGLRARGGFIVSATWHPEQGLEASIESVSGKMCRVRWGEEGAPLVAKKDRPVEFDRDGRDIVFDTEAGACYTLKQQ